jgi:hypothetical protein
MFITVSYALGIFVVTIARIVIDLASSWTLRPLLLWITNIEIRDTARAGWDSAGYGRSKGLVRIMSKALRANRNVREMYKTVIKSALNSDFTEVKNEIVNRRERGRILRSMTIPGLFLPWVLMKDGATVVIVLVNIGTLAAILLLYSYLELSIYQESKDYGRDTQPGSSSSDEM